MFRSLFDKESETLHPDLVAAEKARGDRRVKGDFWFIIPGRTVTNYKDFPVKTKSTGAKEKKQQEKYEAE